MKYHAANLSIENRPDENLNLALRPVISPEQPWPFPRGARWLHEDSGQREWPALCSWFRTCSKLLAPIHFLPLSLVRTANDKSLNHRKRLILLKPANEGTEAFFSGDDSSRRFC